MRMLVVAGAGIGNIIQTTPLIRALDFVGHSVDFFIKSSVPHIQHLFRGHLMIQNVFTNKQQIIFSDYDKICHTKWGTEAQTGPVAKHRRLTINAKLLLPRYRKSEIYRNLTIALQAGLHPEELYGFVTPILNHTPVYEGFPEPPIGIHAGCNPRSIWASKKWPHYNDLVTKLRKAGHKVALFGTKNDQRVRKIDYDCYGQFSIVQTAQAISSCKLFISNDTGPAHIAATIGTPQIILVSGIGAERWAKNDPTIYNGNTLHTIVKPESRKILVNEVMDLVNKCV